MLTSKIIAEAISRREGLVITAFIAIASLSLMIVDDFWKRRLVARARKKGKPIPENWLKNRTDWRYILVLIIGSVFFLYLQANPQLTNRDFGPLNPIARWMFDEPTHSKQEGGKPMGDRK